MNPDQEDPIRVFFESHTRNPENPVIRGVLFHNLILQYLQTSHKLIYSSGHIYTKIYIKRFENSPWTPVVVRTYHTPGPDQHIEILLLRGFEDLVTFSRFFVNLHHLRDLEHVDDIKINYQPSKPAIHSIRLTEPGTTSDDNRAWIDLIWDVFRYREVLVNRPVEDVRRMITYHLRDIGTPVFIPHVFHPKVYCTAYIKRGDEPWTRTLILVEVEDDNFILHTQQPNATERWYFKMSQDAFYKNVIHEFDGFKFSRVRPPVSVDKIIELGRKIPNNGLQDNFGIFANGPLAARLGSFMGSEPGSDSKAIEIEDDVDAESRERRNDERLEQLTRQINILKKRYAESKSPELLEQITALELESSNIPIGSSKRRRFQSTKYRGKGRLKKTLHHRSKK